MVADGTQQYHSPEEQYQRAKADIKNILPVDLYEGMVRASYLKSRCMYQSEMPAERRVREFYETFWGVFSFTRLKIDETLKKKIDSWFSRITIPARNREIILEGVRLYTEFYDELVKLGIGSMFESTIEPPIGHKIQEELTEGLKTI